jgi:hypothetical protein
MYYLEDDMRFTWTTIVLFYILEPLLDVSDVDFLQDDVRSMAHNLSEIISFISSLCKNLEHPLDVFDVYLKDDMLDHLVLCFFVKNLGHPLDVSDVG